MMELTQGEATRAAPTLLVPERKTMRVVIVVMVVVVMATTTTTH